MECPYLHYIGRNSFNKGHSHQQPLYAQCMVLRRESGIHKSKASITFSLISTQYPFCI